MLSLKYDQLTRNIRNLGSAVVAYSGGTDSALVLKLCNDILGPQATIGITAYSASLPDRELAQARAFADAIGARFRMVATHEMSNPGYTENTPRRCFFCKTELYETLWGIAKECDFRHVVNGINRDDQGDFRPGMQAAREYGVKSPLLEAGLSKQDVRDISRKLALSTWNKPAAACLASRIPYGAQVTMERLSKIEQAEYVLQDLGFENCRVRHHDDVARIEIHTADFHKIFDDRVRARAVAGIKQAGFRFVSLDMEGFRSGSMNEGLQ